MNRLITVLLIAITLFSCDKVEVRDVPGIPSYETMIIDFGEMDDTNKSAELVESVANKKTNWLVSATTVGVWSLILNTTLAVPVASFKESYGKSPVKTGDDTWEWTYTFEGLKITYNARLVGTVQGEYNKWEMYITKNGSEEFLWFEGTSAEDNSSGIWILYHSPEYNEEVIKIDWKKEGEDIAEVKYTYVRELNNNDEPDKLYGSYLAYGLRDAEFNAFVHIHIFNEMYDDFTDTYVEWSSADYSGRIKAEHFYQDTEWHCWDDTWKDIDCN
ncbi:MAG: hypothetical protein ABFS16_10390 [Bacteroidota bacterium]